MAASGPSLTTSSSASSKAGDSYIGSLVSLISKYEIRYEGILYCLNTQDSTLGLKNVRSYGTEGRKEDGPQVPASDKVYEYILFRGSDIKDLQVKSSPLAQSDEQMYNDPAIIQSGYAVVPSLSPSVGNRILTQSTQGQDTPYLTSKGYPSSGYAAVPSPSSSSGGRILTQSTQGQDTPALTSKGYLSSGYAAVPSPSPSAGGRILTQSTQGQDLPALTSKGYPTIVPSYQSASQVSTLSQSQTTQNTGSSFASAMYWQGYNGTSMQNSHAPQHFTTFLSSSNVLPPLTVENQIRDRQLETSPIMGLTNSSVSVTPTLSIASGSLNHEFSHSLNPVQSLTSPDMPPPSSVKPSPLSYAGYRTPNGPVKTSFLSPLQDTNTTEAQVIGKAVSDRATVNPARSMPYPAFSFVDSTSGPLLTPPPSLLTPDQLAQSVLSPLQKMYPDQKDMGALTPVSYGISGSVTQAPLLPLPVSTRQWQHPTPQFTEEFDFEGMNEKFKKDEVWGYLGRAKQSDKAKSMEDISTDQSLGKKEEGLLPNLDVKSAYKKDDFFDTISCNSQSRGARNGQHRFTERMRMDTETFGNFQQRTHPGYSGYGARRGGNYGGPNNWGRGYGYGGRSRGGNMPF